MIEEQLVPDQPEETTDTTVSNEATTEPTGEFRTENPGEPQPEPPVEPQEEQQEETPEVHPVIAEEITSNETPETSGQNASEPSETTSAAHEQLAVVEEHPEVDEETGHVYEYVVHDNQDLHADFDKLTEAELISLIKSVGKNEDLTQTADFFRRLREPLDRRLYAARQEAEAAFIEAGGVKEEFTFKSPLREAFNAAYGIYKAKREENRQRLETEKKHNLEKKKAILAKIKVLAEGDETEQSLQQLKDLQAEWKLIRAIPQENNEEMWNLYHYYVDLFYDKLSINYELKELDRQKNLEIKIDLCTKVDALQEEQSIKKALMMLRKYQEDWKATGPVPKEFKDEIWNRFRETVDKVYQSKKSVIDALEAERDANLKAKTALCEQAEAGSQFTSTSIKQWVEQAKVMEQLMAEWKKVGQVNAKMNDAIWERFKSALNAFYARKNDYFKELSASRVENLKKKTELCEKAESLANSDQYNETSKAFKQLQEEWKAIGPVPEKHTEKIWKRFRTACDQFFERKNEFFKSREGDQQANLTAKLALIDELEALVKTEDAGKLTEGVKAIQEKWSAVGFVPMKQKEEINLRFKAGLDAIYQRIRKEIQSNNYQRHHSKYEVIARSSEGKSTLHSEERRLIDRIKVLQAEVIQYQNNLGFFAHSKNASALTKQVEDSIRETQKKIDALNDQLRVLRNVKQGNQEPKANESPAAEPTPDPTPES